MGRNKQTLNGSFSAVSKPHFAIKYAFESSCRDLHNALLCTALQSQFFVKHLPILFCKFCKILAKILAFFKQKIELAELCKGVHCVDLGESFQTHIFLQNFASIQPRTSPAKFARSSGTRRRAATGGGRAIPCKACARCSRACRGTSH